MEMNVQGLSLEDAQSINCFKSRLEKRRARQMVFLKTYSLQVLSSAISSIKKLCMKIEDVTLTYMDARNLRTSSFVEYRMLL